jgi:hypothetical protein
LYPWSGTSDGLAISSQARVGDVEDQAVEEEAVGDGVVGSFEMAGRTRLVKLCWPTAFDESWNCSLDMVWHPEHATTPQPGRCPKWA